MTISLGKTPIEQIRAQLPERVRDRLTLTFKSDPYFLRAEVIHVHGDEKFTCPVEWEWRGRERIGCKIPDWFVAHLLTVPLEAAHD
jgi:hypothetical protein